MKVRFLLSTMVLGSFAAAAAAEPAPRQPSGKWVVNFADAQCLASRNYGTEDDPLFLLLKAPPIGDVLQIGVVRKGGLGNAAQTDGEIVFDNHAPIRTNLLEYGIKKLGQRALLANLPAKELAPMRQAATVRIRAREAGFSKVGSRIAIGRSHADESFSLSQMPALLELMDDCTADLREVWNVYDEKQPGDSLRQPPSGNLASLFRPEDYPAISVFKEQTGTVSLVLLIDEQGKVADCTVAQTSGVAALDAQSCAILKERGKFNPAVGLDGKPAKSSWLQRITWGLRG